MADMDRFLRDIRGHKLTIELDQGVHRSLLLKTPGSSAYHFRVNTWPGHLAISGDMGSYVFFRLDDMFRFFRDPDMTGALNLSYWHQKLEAGDKGMGKEFSREKLSKALKEVSDDWEVRLRDADKVRAEVTELAGGDYGNEDQAYAAVDEFESSSGHQFQEFYEFSLKDYSFHFVWCCRAIVWAIKQYDLVKEGRTQADHDRRVLAGEI